MFLEVVAVTFGRLLRFRGVGADSGAFRYDVYGAMVSYWGRGRIERDCFSFLGTLPAFNSG